MPISIGDIKNILSDHHLEDYGNVTDESFWVEEDGQYFSFEIRNKKVTLIDSFEVTQTGDPGFYLDLSERIKSLVKEKLTKKSSVDTHIKDFQNSDAPQFKGKSKDKKVQMAVASYLSKRNK